MDAEGSPTYPIPDGCSLAPEPEVLLTTEELIKRLQTRRPFTSERNVFAFWQNGLHSLPPWCLRNVLSWMRRIEPEGWTVRLIDALGQGNSENDFAHYFQTPEAHATDEDQKSKVPLAMLPDAVWKRQMTGKYSAQHTSDLIRLPLLWYHGGIWMDVSIMLFRSLEDWWQPLTSPNSEFRVAGFAFQLRPESQIITNSFIAARKGDKFIQTWCDEGCEAWKGKDSCHGLHEHPMFKEVGAMVPAPATMDQSDEAKKEWSDYMVNLLLFEHVRYLQFEDDEGLFDGPEYFRRHFFLLDTIREMYLAQTLTDWDGSRQFDLLCYPTDGPDDTLRKDASEFVSKILADSAIMKLSHGVQFSVPPLAARWDMPENEDADKKPGTFAAYLRFGSEHYIQKRKLEPWKPKDSNKVIEGRCNC